MCGPEWDWQEAGLSTCSISTSQQMKENAMGWACGMRGEKRNTYRFWWGETENKETIWKS